MSPELLTRFEPLLSLITVANLATIDSHGKPHLSPVWFDVEGDFIIVNTAVGRQKDRNMKNNPNVALTIIDPKNPYSYVGIRGRVIERTTDGADAHIDKMTQKYSQGRLQKYPSRSSTEVRILYKIKPERVFGHISQRNPFEK